MPGRHGRNAGPLGVVGEEWCAGAVSDSEASWIISSFFFSAIFPIEACFNGDLNGLESVLAASSTRRRFADGSDMSFPLAASCLK